MRSGNGRVSRQAATEQASGSRNTDDGKGRELTDGKLKVYGDSRSGNCYKVQLLCAEMGVEYDWQEVDIIAGETRTPEFLEMN
jgi:glutathione S-transferase